MAGQHLRQRALAGAVRTHDGVHLAGVDREIDALEDLLVAGARVKVSDFQHRRCSLPVQCRRRRHPTLPSRLIAEQLLRFDRELHRQLLEHFLAEAVDDHRDGVLGVEAALLAGRRSGPRRSSRSRPRARLDAVRVLNVDVREGVRPAAVPDQHRVALGVVPRALGLGQHLHLARGSCCCPRPARDALRHDGAPGVLPHVDHLGAGVGLLPAVHHRHRVELADRVVALEDDARDTSR